MTCDLDHVTGDLDHVTCDPGHGIRGRRTRYCYNRSSVVFIVLVLSMRCQCALPLLWSLFIVQNTVGPELAWDRFVIPTILIDICLNVTLLS